MSTIYHHPNILRGSNIYCSVGDLRGVTSPFVQKNVRLRHKFLKTSHLSKGLKGQK
ncbi:hypothetical protein ACTXT7_002107 [Hymenolepis weldensis]